MHNNLAIIPCLKALSTKIYKYWQNEIYIKTLCFLCDKYSDKSQIICTDCQKLLIPIGHACAICSKPLATFTRNLCADCEQMPPAFDKIYTAFQYEDPLKTIIQTFKYHQGLFLSAFLGELMLKTPIAKQELGLIIPAPLSKASIKTRGYNQAAILANYITKKIKAPYSEKFLLKVKNTPTQVSIPGNKRRTNLENAFMSANIRLLSKFAADSEVQGDSEQRTAVYGSVHEDSSTESTQQFASAVEFRKKSIKPLQKLVVTIIDDIVTTGSTAHHMALTLKNHGVAKVNIWCCARAKSTIL